MLVLKAIQMSKLVGAALYLMAAVPLVPSAPAMAHSVVVAYQPRQSQPRQLQSLRKVALQLVNRDRARYGLLPLREDRLLERAAQGHAEDMLRRNYFSHYSPEGKTAMDRFAAVGGRGGASENLVVLQNDPTLARGVSYAKMAWFQKSLLNSPTHRRNLLDARAGRFGFGIAVAGDRLYAVQMFSLP